MSSIYGGSRGGWRDMNDVVQPATHLRAKDAAQAQEQQDSTDWSHVRKAKPADYLLPQSEKWFDLLPPEVQPCALVSQYPRIVNLIVAQWNDLRGAPELFEELLGDRRGGRAGFPPVVRRDLVKVQEYWYSGALKL
ncbi:MAG TPA: hypothetical protein VF059_01780 [Casimicrobiaceae bacterium]